MKVIIEHYEPYEGSSYYFVDVAKVQTFGEKFNPLLDFIEDRMTTDMLSWGNFPEAYELLIHMACCYDPETGKSYDYEFDFPAYVDASMQIEDR